METKVKEAETKIKREIAEAEKEIAEEVTEIEEKVEEHKLSQKEADKKIEEEVNEEVKKASKEISEIKEDTNEKKKKGKEDKIKRPKKTEAVVYGKDLPISTKHAIAICSFIRWKKIDEAMYLLGEVIHFKRAVPMKGELPHRRGKGMERGRYPINAANQFVKLLKQLAANATVNEIELEKGIIECKADRAARPYRRFGDQKFKRSHVTLKLTIKEKKRKKN